jgi:hypothetical protein
LLKEDRSKFARFRHGGGDESPRRKLLREESPPEAIVNTWWDYGYWTKYLAGRRVNADGGSLATHILYWTGRALAAPTERESAGRLRMIDCGSDATPQPEGREGAYGKLRTHQVTDSGRWPS